MMGIGDWGLGIGDWAHSPIPNPQSPIPNPQSPTHFIKIMNCSLIIILTNINNSSKFYYSFLLYD